jgi:hypothetical protein
MTIDSPVERINDPADADRCQAMDAYGQCRNKAVKNGTVCMVHGGDKQLQSQELTKIRNFRLTKWQAQLDAKTDSSVIKSLREEIGILRILLEERMNRCDDVTDLMLQSGPISDLVMKIERVVGSCHKLEGSMGQLLDKQALLNFASNVITIISEVLDGQDEAIDAIATRILQAVGAGSVADSVRNSA